MAGSSHTRSRHSRDARREPRYVTPVLDPTWVDPYVPQTSERHQHAAAVRRFALRRRSVYTAVVAILVIAGVVAGFIVGWWMSALALVVGAAYALDLRRVVVGYDRRGSALAAKLREQMAIVRDEHDEQRLATVVERLGATFGVDRVTPYIFREPSYNAALAPDNESLALFVSDAMLRDFELIELEGVVAHLFARHRLGLMSRQAVAAVSTTSDESRRALSQPGSAYRADEVAAAQIRYPLGIAQALRQCAKQVRVNEGLVVSDYYDQWRWIFFDVCADRIEPDLSDLDDTTLRAMALEEW